MFPTVWIHQAQKTISPYIKTTPLTYDPSLDIFIKWENLQETGSFKVRGAINKILSLSEWERKQGIVTASAGNHGAGISYACSLVNEKATVFVPEKTPQIKLDKIIQFGAIIEKVAGDYHETENVAIKYAKDNHANYVSPYNDSHVVAGQATIALEILDQLPDPNPCTWLVPVSGGGLLSGIGAVIKNPELLTSNRSSSKITLLGVQTQAAPFMFHLFHYGEQNTVDETPTIADGLSGAVEEGSITIPLIKKFVDDILLIGETDIINAVKYAWQKYDQVIEGAAAVTLAAVLSNIKIERPAIVIISGGNIQPRVHQKILESV